MGFPDEPGQPGGRAAEGFYVGARRGVFAEVVENGSKEHNQCVKRLFRTPESIPMVSEGSDF